EGNYHLQPGSPCIDTGDPSFPLEADGTIIDMGALSTGDEDPPGEGTEVCGDVGDQTWTVDGSPYIVTCPEGVEVPVGKTLTIEPAVEVRFDVDTGLNVSGSLNAIGTLLEGQRILFTSNEPSPTPGDWDGIDIEHDAYMTITYVTIEYADQAVRANNFVWISRSIIHRNADDGIWLSTGCYNGAMIQNNTIVNNGGTGIEVWGEYTLIQNNIIAENGLYGIHAEPCMYPHDGPTLLFNDVWGNLGGDYHREIPGTGDISENPRFVNSGGGDYNLQSSSPCIDAGDPDPNDNGQADPGDLDPDGTRMDIGAIFYPDGENVGGQIWTEAWSPYIVDSDMFVPEGTTFTIEPGVEVRFDGDYRLLVRGTLDAVGTPTERIIFTSNQATPSTGDWDRIVFEGYNSNAVIEHATIEYASCGIDSSGSRDLPIRISHSIIHHNTTGMTLGTRSKIYNNTITHNSETGMSTPGNLISIKNNIITENGLCGIDGLGRSPALSHNNVWGNGTAGVVNYVNVSPGTGDISANPLFVNALAVDYRLQDFDSPCIDKGHPYTGLPEDDFSQEPYYNGGRINIGAYGNTPEAAKTEIITTGGGCFLAGTKISMSDGSTKPIEEVQLGDMVLAYDTVAREMKPNKVTELIRHPKENVYYVVNGHLRVTPIHGMLSQGKWVKMGDMRMGDTLTNIKGEDVPIWSIVQVKEWVDIYNLEVEPNHTYVAEGYIVHNSRQVFKACREPCGEW
ncbi:right-handed parallel beta-helix repeat-containing protein, partial [Candidatus Omnitrophota bacterium]